MGRRHLSREWDKSSTSDHIALLGWKKVANLTFITDEHIFAMVFGFVRMKHIFKFKGAVIVKSRILNHGYAKVTSPGVFYHGRSALLLLRRVILRNVRQS